ncbi:glycosyltransferase family 2 protein [Sphingomonas glacialis]|uniref:glycosyltransferase family 2 protein n=1 Tax=Sphingomonas glacialis TaxID=658225 RepID=UPI001386B85F|nr:glycosyltransferase family 2 protein [Sphingomonas glacialis]
MSIVDDPSRRTDPIRTVDIVIAAYNAAATIGETIKSALAQPETASVIVVDDSSRDDTVAVATARDDGTGRLQVLRQDRNGGPSRARNRGIAVCSAPWFTVLDADDVFLPGRLAALLQHADEADLIADDLLVRDEGAAETRPMFFPPVDRPQALDAAAFINGNISHGAKGRRDLGFIKPLIRRELLVRHAVRFDDALWLGEDYELYTRALLLGGRLLLVPAAGYVYTVRPTSLSGEHTIDALRMLRDCDQGLATIPGLTTAQRKALDDHYQSVDRRLQWRLLIEAVKRRDAKAAVATFSRSGAVSVFLVGMLLQEAVRRVRLALPS